MKCALCKMNIHISEFDLETAGNCVNPLTFRNANMHMDCLVDAMDLAKETPSKNRIYESRLEEWEMTKVQ